MSRNEKAAQLFTRWLPLRRRTGSVVLEGSGSPENLITMKSKKAAVAAFFDFGAHMQ